MNTDKPDTFAQAVGFEPTEDSHPHRHFKPARSATTGRLQVGYPPRVRPYSAGIATNPPKWADQDNLTPRAGLSNGHQGDRRSA